MPGRSSGRAGQGSQHREWEGGGQGGGDGGGGVGLSAGWQSMLVLQGLAPGLWFNRRKACWQVLKQSETPLHTL